MYKFARCSCSIHLRNYLLCKRTFVSRLVKSTNQTERLVAIIVLSVKSLPLNQSCQTNQYIVTIVFCLYSFHRLYFLNKEPL